MKTHFALRGIAAIISFACVSASISYAKPHVRALRTASATATAQSDAQILQDSEMLVHGYLTALSGRVTLAGLVNNQVAQELARLKIREHPLTPAEATESTKLLEAAKSTLLDLKAAQVDYERASKSLDVTRQQLSSRPRK